MKYVYLTLSIVGTVLPLSQFYPFIVKYGINVNLFFSQLFINEISSFFAMDVFVSAVVTAFLIAYETKRLKIKNTWICYIGLFVAGVSCGLPLFLYLREANLESKLEN
jgi:hypothetical protein